MVSDVYPIVLFIWGPFWLPLGLALGSIGHSGGAPWPTLGSKWVLLGRPWDPLGVSWAPKGSTWGGQGDFWHQNDLKMEPKCSTEGEACGLIYQ